VITKDKRVGVIVGMPGNVDEKICYEINFALGGEPEIEMIAENELRVISVDDSESISELMIAHLIDRERGGVSGGDLVWFVKYPDFPDLPGCVSFGADLSDARKNAIEAFSLHLSSLRDDADKIPAFFSVRKSSAIGSDLGPKISASGLDIRESTWDNDFGGRSDNDR